MNNKFFNFHMCQSNCNISMRIVFWSPLGTCPSCDQSNSPWTSCKRLFTRSNFINFRNKKMKMKVKFSNEMTTYYLNNCISLDIILILNIHWFKIDHNFNPNRHFLNRFSKEKSRTFVHWRWEREICVWQYDVIGELFCPKVNDYVIRTYTYRQLRSEIGAGARVTEHMWGAGTAPNPEKWHVQNSKTRPKSKIAAPC